MRSVNSITDPCLKKDTLQKDIFTKDFLPEGNPVTRVNFTSLTNVFTEDWNNAQELNEILKIPRFSKKSASHILNVGRNVERKKM